jgi:hypothetical protein
MTIASFNGLSVLTLESRRAPATNLMPGLADMVIFISGVAAERSHPRPRGVFQRRNWLYVE